MKDMAPPPIAMTAPVLSGSGMMQFVLPASRFERLEAVPAPTDPLVSVREVEGRTVAAATYSWSMSQADAAERAVEIAAAVDKDDEW